MLNIKEKLINISSIRVEYENGVYCGCHNGFSKEGIGCFYSDDNMIYIGEWLRDKLNGLGIIFFPKNGLFYGNFAKNKINGLGIIAYSNEDLVIGYFDNGNLKGICFFYNASQNIWNIEEYESGFKINDVKKNYKIKNDKEIPYFLFTYPELPNLYTDFKNKKFLSNIEMNFSSNIFIKNMILNNEEQYLGYVINSEPNGLGIIYKNNTALIIGEFKNGLLEGLGRKTFENESFEEGIWKNGCLQNLGIKYDFGTNEYKLCSFYENKLLKEYKAGENIPINLLMELKNKIHKTSLNYIDKSFQFSELNLSKELFLKMFINVNRHNSPKKCDPKMKMSQYYFQNNTSTFVSPSLQTENSIIFDLTSSQKKRNASIKNSFNSSPKKKKSNLKTNTYKSKNSSEKSDRKKEKLKEGFFKKGYSLRISEQISPIPKHKEIDEFSKPSRKNLDALSGQSKENSNFMFEDSSLSRLKFLGIDSVVENISKLEEKNKDILSPEKGFVSIF